MNKLIAIYRQGRLGMAAHRGHTAQVTRPDGKIETVHSRHRGKLKKCLQAIPLWSWDKLTTTTIDGPGRLKRKFKRGREGFRIPAVLR